MTKSIFLFLSLLTICPTLGTIDELAPLVPDMSENLYFSLFKEKNDSVAGKAYNFLNKGDIENFRRYSMWVVNTFWPYAYYKKDIIHKACSAIRYIYRGSLDYIYRYYNIRALYHNTIEYDVGYLTHQIIFRYQIMVETYHIVIRRFVLNPDQRALTISPFFYLYTNMIEQAQVIIHLVNMLEESENKYRGITNPNWIDRSTKSRRRRPSGGGQESAENDSASGVTRRTVARGVDGDELEMSRQYQLQRLKNLKKQRRERKKQRQAIQKGLIQTLPPRATYSRHKTFGHWDYEYGWSIEDW